MHLILPRQDRVLGAALGLSFALHAALLSMHFKFPEGQRWKQESAPLEVVLVNAKTKLAPAKADVLAQANLDRGGNRGAEPAGEDAVAGHRAAQAGQGSADAQRRQRSLEARQQELLAQTRGAAALSPPSRARGRHRRARAQPSGRDLADLTLAAMRLQAQIDRQIEEYQKRPRKQFIGANAASTVSRSTRRSGGSRSSAGTLNYPAEARGKLYGNLRLTVTIRPDGSVESIELDRSSGLKVLDAAAFKIVRMATPFAAFPPDIRRDTDLLVITRTWFFGQGDKIWTE